MNDISNSLFNNSLNQMKTPSPKQQQLLSELCALCKGISTVNKQSHLFHFQGLGPDNEEPSF